MDFAVITVARSDFSRLKPTLQAIQNAQGHNLHLIVAGNHDDSKFGDTLSEISSSGFPICCQIKGSGAPAKSASAILDGVYSYLEKNKLDFFLILGDRFEMLAAAQAATLARVPIIHIGGGYTTTGAIDNSIRDAISKLSKYHLVATEKCQEKVIGMGEDASSVFVTGAPDLEMINEVEKLSRSDFCKEVGLDPDFPYLLVTLHPETRMAPDEHRKCVDQFGEFLIELNYPVLITSPCADPGASDIFMMIEFLNNNEDVVYRKSLGGRLYINALIHASMVIGNSSSGIIEAGSFEVPIINVGERQNGREQNANVLNSSFNLTTLLKTFEKANGDEFRTGLRGVENLYGDGAFKEKFSYLFL